MCKRNCARGIIMYLKKADNGELYEYTARCDCELGKALNPKIPMIDEVFPFGGFDKYDPVANLIAIKKENGIIEKEDEESNKAIELYENGYGYDYIGKIIGKTGQQVRGKIERLKCEKVI